MPRKDVRWYIEEFQRIDELQVIDGADWDLEIGALAESSCGQTKPPALLFDNIKGYSPGFRLLTNIYNTLRRTAICLDLPDHLRGVQLVQALRKRVKAVTPLPPRLVNDSPLFENVLTGDNVNVLNFPAPKWHQHDGGRFIGTCDAVIMRDPDTGYVNVGTYRVQVHDKSTLGIKILPGKDGYVIREKYWAKGESCPVAIACGVDPALFCVTSQHIPWGLSEYDYLGGYIGEPYEVVKGRFTDLPVPAGAEVVLEGEIPPPDIESRPEGPFGEWTGYYASGARAEPVVRVEAVLHRNDPVLTGYFHPYRTYYNGYNNPVGWSARLWDEIEKVGIRNVKGVWVHPAGFRFFVVVSIKQLYGGHARQAGFACLAGPTAGLQGRFVVVVDDDIDPCNTDEVLWAMSTRCDPETSIEIVRDCWSSDLDPRIPPEKREKGDWTNSRAVVNACRPFHWIKDFPSTSESDPEYKRDVERRWSSIFRRE